MNNETSERAAFEAWAQSNSFHIDRDDSDKYRDYHRATTRFAWEAWQARASAATQAAPEHIPATLTHDEGAFAQCGDCGRYSLDPRALTDRPPACECGSKTGWCGSFKKPGPHSRWSGAAPKSAAAPVVPPVALPALTDEDRAILQHVHDVLDEDYGNAPGHCHDVPGIWDDDNGEKSGKPCEWCATWAKFTELIERNRAILAASAAPAPEQMQPNAQDKGHSAMSTSSAPCGDEAVERDAARYRWLRVRGAAFDGDHKRHLENGLVYRIGNLDDAIDAVMQREGTK